MNYYKIYQDIAAEFTTEGKLVPTRVEWEDKNIYNIGILRNVQEYKLEKYANIGPCMDISAHKGHLYAIQRSSQYPGGRLCVLTADMQLVGEYVGIGNARQIETSGNIAVITAREGGLWIFDIQDTTPRLLSHYQTLEYATGVTLYANFALISCRQYGVEIVDISNPEKPKHVGIIRVGEVQSACVYEGYLYCGVWGAMSVVVVDIRDILHYRVVARLPLEGRGDGVFAEDGKLYVVTGQHRRGIRNVSDDKDPCFGEGNGLVVFDINDLQKPKVLHSEFFGKCYNISFDMWKPMICGNFVISGCSSLGVFVCDKKSYEPKFRLRLPGTEAVGKTMFTGKLPDAVTSFAALGNNIYVCGANSDLFAFDITQISDNIRENDTQKYGAVKSDAVEYDTVKNITTEYDTLKSDAAEYDAAEFEKKKYRELKEVTDKKRIEHHREEKHKNVTPVKKQPFHVHHEDAIEVHQRFSPEDAPVLGVCECKDVIAIACGSAGISLLNKEDFTETAHLAVSGCCYDVKYTGGNLAAALSDAGIIICKIEDNKISIISHIETDKPVQQLCLSADTNYLLCGHGTGQCQMWDISDKEHPKMVTYRDAVQGPLYGDNFTSGTLEDGTMLLFWHRDGLIYTNPSAGDLTFHNIFYKRTNSIMQLGPEHGCDTDGKHIFYTLKDGYVFLPMEENIDADTLQVYQTDTPLTGKITVCGNWIVACERARGIITVTDISNKKAPKHIGTAITNASPGKAVCIDGHIFIPAWYGGLLEICIRKNSTNM